MVLHYADGIVFVAENRSQALHKVSEIYDRIGFAAVGRYNEFENLRMAGIRYADLRGYSYDRTDVTGRGLANAYAQLLGTIFSSGGEKPYEVEIVVAELGATSAQDQIYRLTYDGSVADEDNFAVMGGSAEAIAEVVWAGLRARARAWPPRPSSPCGAWLRRRPNGQSRRLGVDALEVAILDRTRRCPASSAGSPATGWPRLLTETSSPPIRGRAAAQMPPEPAVTETELPPTSGARTVDGDATRPGRDRSQSVPADADPTARGRSPSSSAPGSSARPSAAP